MLLLLGIGYYSMRKTHNNQDYIIGSRSLGPITSAISAGASDMSSCLLLGLPGAVFAAGLVEGFWISLGLTLGAYINWYVVAPRLRVCSEKLNAVTLPTFLSNRFDDASGILRIVSTLVILFFFTLYVSSGLTGVFGFHSGGGIGGGHVDRRLTTLDFNLISYGRSFLFQQIP